MNNLRKPPVARKLAVRHTKLVCLTASFLATGGFKFKYFKMHTWPTSMLILNTLLLLHSTFMLKGEVGGHALNT